MKNLKSTARIILILIVFGLVYSCKKSNPVIPTPTPLPPVNLIAHWKLNGDATDASRYGNNGTAVSTTAVTDRFGHANSALQFNGVSSYVVVPDSIRLRLGNTDFTLNAWVKLHSYNSDAVSAIMSKRMMGLNNGWLFGLNGTFNTFLGPLGSVYYGPGGGNTNAVGTSGVALDQWTMVTCVYSLSAQTLKVYINGALDNSTNGIQTANSTVSVPLYIGTDQTSPGQQQYFLDGALDDLRIYNTALDQSSINQLYTATE